MSEPSRNSRRGQSSSSSGSIHWDQSAAWTAKVSRSGYYDWLGREPSARARRRADLAVLVRYSFERSDGTYGYRRVHAELHFGFHCVRLSG